MLSFFLAVVLSAAPARANERIRPRAVLEREGYRLVATAAAGRADVLPAPHSLPWPVAFQDPSHTIGNSMVEYQPFGDPYYHGGCDLRTEAGAELHAPVGGRLEAGHYSYSNNPDGSLTKYWMPWPEQGDSTYFEVAVVDDSGVRYELHHVDRSSLPGEIVKLLDAGGGRVTAGAFLGKVLRWPDGDYHHTHYNIVLPSGVRVNPEFASPLLADSMAPELLGLFAVANDGQATEFGDGKFKGPLREFVADVVDHQDGNIYDHPPVYARLKFTSGQETLWDFRTTLTGPGGIFPPLWSFFLASLRSPDGLRETEGGYGTGHSLIRLSVPSGASGPFTIELGDEAGNITRRSGTLVI